LKQYRELSYEELAYHLEDSYSFREFARMDYGQYPGKSVLQDNIKSLSEDVWEKINRVLVSYAEEEKLETLKKIRIDSTAIETNIHYPTDSTLLEDGVRFITRWLSRGKGLTPKPSYAFSDHTRVIKKRVITILNARKDRTRVEAYRDILHYASLVRDYGISAIKELDGHPDFLSSAGIVDNLDRGVRILEKVMDQTRRRVFKKETIPASEKIFSFFEDHTDIIVKGRRDTQYGHKVFLSGGASGMILDCAI
jgi:IS5 family transposase